MKCIRRIQFTLALIPVATFSLKAQDCVEYHKYGDCMRDRQKGYEFYSQSKSVSITAADTVEFNVVFYRQKEYIFSFCTHGKLNPVHFVLIDPESDKVLYDNEKDHYISSLGIGFEVTKTLAIKVDVAAHNATHEEREDYAGCLGLLIQYRNFNSKPVNRRM